ncbi:sigma-70 family RNA polymerase sigma factor [Vibrio tapetis subsp. quintayensis]|uniref:sigma-70 family RNA polymerase sigma factor n=1 Tax=Vibrio tapetis TaxID=52443 RepID=UPI0025B5E54F|nr:sigma-70 family RNA polymerase sigma factor [Vibrio tapetis]MDN3682959.1 sigma-70 family RNA polymerase sigma factor [Vibrio tapetis subsp. quintayensis]
MKAWNESESLLYYWLLKQTQSQHETEDIMQEVFLKAMSNSNRFCSLNDGKSWLFKMVKNQFIDCWRRQVKVDGIGRLEAPATTPPVMEQLQTCLPRILPKLSTNHRHIIETCDLNNMTQVAYASAHGLSLPATKARLRRARLELKQKLITECQVLRNTSGVYCFKRAE